MSKFVIIDQKPVVLDPETQRRAIEAQQHEEQRRHEAFFVELRAKFKPRPAEDSRSTQSP